MRWKKEAGFGDSELGEIIGVPTLAWSPDGERIAFTSYLAGKVVVGVVAKNGGNPKPVANGYAAQWSADGKQLLFRHDSETTSPVTSIWIANADGTQPRRVLDNEAAEYGLTWFPDGKTIAFASERESKNHSEIFRVNVDGTGLEKIATQKDRGLMLSCPIISPDGSKLIVEASLPWSFEQTTNEFGLLSVDLANQRQEQLTKGSHASIIWEKH